MPKAGRKETRLDIEELWIEKIARITYTEKLGKKLTGRVGLGPYIFQWIFQIVNIVILPIIAFIQFGWSIWLETPIALVLTVFGITFAVWAVKKYKIIYHESINKLSKTGVICSKSRYKYIVPRSVKHIVFLLGMIALLIRIICLDVIQILQNPVLINSPGPENLNIFSFGLVRGIIISLIWLIIYLPLLAEFVSMFFGIHIFLPIKLRKFGINIDYTDPHLFGGMKPIGNLFGRSAGIYFLGLTVYLIATIGAQYRFGLASTAFFAGGWILGFVLFFLPQLIVHKQMKLAKQKKLEEIEAKLRKEGSKRESFLETEPIDIVESAKYIHRYVEYNHAEKLNVYPFDMGTMRDLALTAIIPISAEVVIRIYFHYIGM